MILTEILVIQTPDSATGGDALERILMDIGGIEWLSHDNFSFSESWKVFFERKLICSWESDDDIYR